MVTTGMPTSSFSVVHADRTRKAGDRHALASVVAHRSGDRSALVPGVAAQRGRAGANAGTDRGWPPTSWLAGGGHAKSARSLRLRPPAYRVQEERRASAAASARLRTPSLARMFETWTLPVFSLM